MSFIKRNKEVFIAPLITMLILFIIYALKGVYPFGDRSIAYYDMPLQYVPMYHHTFDFLHGKAPAFFDWYNGCGADYVSDVTNYCFRPLNIFFLFVKRGDLLYSMGFFLMIKLMLSSATMSFYLKKSYNNGFLINTAMALMYTFGGYSLQNHINIHFVDLLIFFPLFMMALDHMLKNAKPFWYTFAATYMLLINSYLTAMVFIFTLLYSAGYILFMQNDNRTRGKTAANLGIYTLLALLIASVFLLPAVNKLSNSTRVTNNDVSYFNIILTREGEFDVQKQFMLFGSEFGVAALALTIFMAQQKKQKLDNDTKFRAYLAALLLIPIVSEGCNLLWHMGSYSHFPYRFGFILSFVFIDVLARFLSKHNEEAPIKSVRKPAAATAAKALALLITAAQVVLLTVMCYKLSYQSVPDSDSYIFYGFLLILSLMAAFLVLCFCGKKMRTAVLITLAVMQSGIGSYGFIAPRKFTVKPDSYMLVEKSDFDVPDDNISRIKQLNFTSAPNYQQYIGLPSLSDWTLHISEGYWKSNIFLGYSHQYTDTYDNGGTAFSDALLNVKQAFATRDYDDALYTLAHKKDNVNIYDCKYTLPFGILIPDTLPDLSYESDTSVFENQNEVYKAITGTDEELISVHSLTDVIVDEKSEFEITLKTPNVYAASIEIKEPSVLYAYTKDVDLSYQFIVNGEKVYFPYRTLDDNTVYPGPKDNGIIYIGSFDNEKIKLSVAAKDDDTSKLCFGVMSIPKLEKLCSSYSDGAHAYDVEASGTSLSMKVDDPQGRTLFLPLEYNKNWRVKVNGSKADVTPVLNGSFMAIKLGSENAEIEMDYIPYDNIHYLFITLAALAAFAVLMVLRKKKHDPAETKGLQMTALVCFTAVAAAALIVVYAAPSVGYFITLFRDIADM